MILPISGADAELASSGINIPRSWPPAPPPIAPAIVFPIVPRSMFLAAPAATLPPTAPAMIWIIRLMSIPDMARNSRDPVFSFSLFASAGPSPDSPTLGGWPAKVTLRQRRKMKNRRGRPRERRALSVAAGTAQRRQPDAGRIEAAINGENLAGDVARPVAAKEEHRLGQFFLEAVAVERDPVLVVGADFTAVNRFGLRGVDRPRR